MAEPSNPASAIKDKGDSHYLELDGMRGVLACGVMGFHLGLNTVVAQLTAGRIQNGAWPLCVDFFFALSGFVLCRSFLKRRTGLAQYAVKRVLRLAPMFLVTSALMLTLTGPGTWSALEIAANGLIVQSLFGLRSINFVSWSIPFELVLPVVGLMAAPHIARWPRAVLLACLGLALLAQALAACQFVLGRDQQYLRAAAGLAAGGFLFLLRDLRPQPAQRYASLSAALLFAAVLAVMALTGAAPGLAAIFPVLVAGAIWCGAAAKGLFTLAPLQALGRWSYSIYLLHIPVLSAVERVWGTDLSPLTKATVLATTVALAGLTYRMIERPFMNMGVSRAA